MKRKASKPKLLRSKPFMIKRTRAGKNGTGFWALDYCEVWTYEPESSTPYGLRVLSVCEDGFTKVAGLKLRPGRKRLFRLVEIKQ